MKRKAISFFSFLLLSLTLSSAVVFAASTYSFTYNLKHQLSVNGKKTATKSTADFSFSTTSNGGSDTYFTVKQFKYNALGTDTYLDSETISCTANSSDTCSFSTTSGTSYTYEFWKPTAIGYVVGSGTLTY